MKYVYLNETFTMVNIVWQKKTSAIEESNAQAEAHTSYPYQKNG